jgi:hypothetical protein
VQELFACRHNDPLSKGPWPTNGAPLRAKALRARSNFGASGGFCCGAAIFQFMVNIFLQYVVKYFHLKAAVMFPQGFVGPISGVGLACPRFVRVRHQNGGSQDRQGWHVVVSGREGE